MAFRAASARGTSRRDVRFVSEYEASQPWLIQHDDSVLTKPYFSAQAKKNFYSKYLTIWQKQQNGEWRWVADLGNSQPPP